MAAYGELLLNKIIENDEVVALKRYGIDESHFNTKIEREAFRYITGYAEVNAGKAPSYAAVVDAVEGFVYLPEITDSYEWLTRNLKGLAARRKLAELIEGKLSTEFNMERDGNKLIEYLQKELEEIKIGTSVRDGVGKTLVELKDEFIAEYRKRKEGKSFKIWKTPFEALNKEIGGLYTGDVYGVFGESGRGKSYLIIVIVDFLLRQGAKILVKSFEMTAFRFLSRLFSVMTAAEETIIDKEGRKVGVPNREILMGNLSEDYEEWFLETVAKVNEYYPGELILQAKGDAMLTRSLDDLERELEQSPDIDAVVIDPIYGFSDVYGRNSNRTAGGAAEQATRRLEYIIGEQNVVGIYAVQAEVAKKAIREDAEGEDEARELKLPRRDQVKTSKALLEIATILFSFDSNSDGLAKIGIEKGRDGGEDFELELMSLLDYGVLREFPQGEAVAEHFTEHF